MTSFPIPANYANHVLVASPSIVVRQRVLEKLRSPVRLFEQASGGAEALVHLETGFWQVLFLDRRLPDLDAEELSETVRQRFPGIEVVLLDSDGATDHCSSIRDSSKYPSREGENETVVASTWPVATVASCRVGPDGHLNPADCSSATIDNEADDEIVPIRAQPDSPETTPTAMALPKMILPGMIGNARTMQPVYRLVRLLAPRTTTVLITGPTGSGKEIVARAIHQLSPRSARTFAVVNCAAIPETLLEAELFGYARGAFTGAMQSYAGRIQTAQGGTLFLDEIGEMPLSLQPKLLRFLEQKELQRLGSSEVIRIDARVVSATNAHLLTLVREGKFREDLYYRLCAFPIEIPSLRDRSEDIAPLAAHFLAKYAAPLPAPCLSTEALQLLKAQPWSGNIRELQNVIERALVLSEGQALIRAEHVLLTDSTFRSSH
jgi:DNA-binding NtrC family response regulator